MKISITSLFLNVIAFITPQAAQKSYHTSLTHLYIFDILCEIELLEV